MLDRGTQAGSKIVQATCVVHAPGCERDSMFCGVDLGWFRCGLQSDC